MESIMQVQTCSLCESTNVHYDLKTDKFICNTCGHAMSEQETSSKVISRKQYRTLLRALCVCCLLLSMCLSCTVPQKAAGKNNIFSEGIAPGYMEQVRLLDSIGHSYNAVVQAPAPDTVDSAEVVIEQAVGLGEYYELEADVLRALNLGPDSLYYLDGESGIFKRKEWLGMWVASFTDTGFTYYRMVEPEDIPINKHRLTFKTLLDTNSYYLKSTQTATHH